MVLNSIRNILFYRHFIIGSVSKDFRQKYVNSFFGFFWSVLNPFFLIFLYFIIFNKFLKISLLNDNSSVNYAIYICLCLIHWNLFIDLFRDTKNIFVTNAELLRRYYVPKYILLNVIIINALINYFISLFIFLLLCFFFGKYFSFVTINFIPIVFLFIFFSIIIGLIFGYVNVFFRDIDHIFPFVTTIWFWLTPILYDAQTLPDNLQIYIKYNPIFELFQSLKNIFILNLYPSWSNLNYFIYISFFLLLILFFFYRKLNNHLIDHI